MVGVPWCPLGAGLWVIAPGQLRKKMFFFSKHFGNHSQQRVRAVVAGTRVITGCVFWFRGD